MKYLTRNNACMLLNDKECVIAKRFKIDLIA